ncbi:MAG: hypothetical protein M1833_006695 [Piccolia ochrophora]|nr:MAG: hypothetical protein M1833_006695 [Piccolia ochrophora]
MSVDLKNGDLATAAQRVLTFTRAYLQGSARGTKERQLFRDVSCLHRTILQAHQMRLSGQLTGASFNIVMQLVGSTSPDQADTFRSFLITKLISVNLVLSTVSYQVLAVKNNYPPGHLLSALRELEYPNPSSITPLDENALLPVHEHIRPSSGGKCRFPGMNTFVSQRNPHTFFRPGRVFFVLYPTLEVSSQSFGNKPRHDSNIDRGYADDIVDQDPAVAHLWNRARLSASSINEPFPGAAGAVRRFVTVKEGPRSSYCLMVSTMHSRGSADQPDQENYGIMYLGTARPKALAGEFRMSKQPIHVEPSDPAFTLPTATRIDYRRLCEVEHGVEVEPLGTVAPASMPHLLGNFEACRERGVVEEARRELVQYATADRDVDPMDLT